ncbi:MAG: deoxyguanosinetriphosphate triphosphohydrolase, partial [Phycisphaeraceae bacterium]|nr:deoxyguanosinetriphosphate triphosphohydrolase [Phycisphaeraceae bacterium]
KLPRAISEINEQWNLELDTWPSAEAQVAALADDIAYHNHDIDDGLRAGLFTLEQLIELPLVGNVFKTLMGAHPGIDKQRLTHEAIRRLINMMVVDVIRETRRRVTALKIKTITDIRLADTAIVTFSEEMAEYNRTIRKFLMDNMYRHYRVNRMSSKARRIMKELFRIFLEEPDCLPDEWRSQTDGVRTIKTAQVVCDYIAGMTDRYAIDEYQRLFDISEKS